MSLTSGIDLEDRKWEGRGLQRAQQVVRLLAAARRDPDALREADRLDGPRESAGHPAVVAGPTRRA